MTVDGANPAGGSDSGAMSDPVAMIEGLLERESPPTKPARNQGPAPEPEQDEPERPEPGPETPPEDEDGEDGEEQPEQQQDPEEPEMYTVKIDGKEARVTRDELLNGYQRQADYSRKTAEIAEQRRAAEQEIQRVAAERNHYATQLEQVAMVLHSNLPQPPEPSLLQTDPITYVQQKELYETRVRQLQVVLSEKHQADEQNRQYFEQQRGQSMQAARAQLLEALPEWKEPEKARAGQREVADYLRTIGYADAEIAQAADPRAIVMARKAMLYDKLQASQPKVQQKLATAPKMVKPGAAGPAPDQAKALTQQVKRSGGKDMDAIARLIELG